MRSEWTRKYDALVDTRGFDPRKVSGEVQTLGGGFTDLSVLRDRLASRGEGQERGWADLVVMAQAWHWAHPDYEAAIVSRRLEVPLVIDDGSKVGR